MGIEDMPQGGNTQAANEAPHDPLAKARERLALLKKQKDEQEQSVIDNVTRLEEIRQQQAAEAPALRSKLTEAQELMDQLREAGEDTSELETYVTELQADERNTEAETIMQDPAVVERVQEQAYAEDTERQEQAATKQAAQQEQERRSAEVEATIATIKDLFNRLSGPAAEVESLNGKAADLYNEASRNFDKARRQLRVIDSQLTPDGNYEGAENRARIKSALEEQIAALGLFKGAKKKQALDVMQGQEWQAYEAKALEGDNALQRFEAARDAIRSLTLEFNILNEKMNQLRDSSITDAYDAALVDFMKTHRWRWDEERGRRQMY